MYILGTNVYLTRTNMNQLFQLQTNSGLIKSSSVLFSYTIFKHNNISHYGSEMGCELQIHIDLKSDQVTAFLR